MSEKDSPLPVLITPDASDLTQGAPWCLLLQRANDHCSNSPRGRWFGGSIMPVSRGIQGLGEDGRTGTAFAQLV